MKSTPMDMNVTIQQDHVPEFLVKAHGLAHAGQTDGALACLDQGPLDRVRDLTPGSELFLSCMLVLGSTWRRLGRLAPAIEAYEKVRNYRPDAAVLFELISLYRNVGRFTLAHERSREAMAQWGDYPEIKSLHAECLMSLGRMDEGIRVMKELVESGQATCESHLLYAWYLSYLTGVDRKAQLTAYRHWSECHASPTLARTEHGNNRDPDRRLRIGYLSSDLRTHSVTYTFEPLLDGHHREDFEVFGYGHVAHPDATTERLKAKFDGYRDVWGKSGQDIAELVHADGIDILVTLAGHCSATCLQAMACKPAPIQVDMGSVCSTGLTQIDYRITDVLQDPPATQADHTERLVPIPGGFIPYHAPLDAPAVGPLPALTCGQVTFGSFANHLKINQEVVAVWAEILQRTPRSRLLLKAAGGHDSGVTEHLLSSFETRGVARSRIRVIGWLPKQDHWNLYNQVDLALDTFPYNGGLTNLEALWMGVPTVTLAGDTFVARTGLAILTHAGLRHLVAHTRQQMIAKAVALADNLDLLARLRAHLRSALWGSPLCDSQRIARETEAAYRRMWVQWVQSERKSTMLDPLVRTTS